MAEDAIAAVSRALRDIVAEALVQEPALVEKPEHVVLSSPAEIPRDRHARLAVFLYRVNEHVLSRPEAMEIRGPLGFALSYVLAPVGPDAVRCQQMLGRVLRVLHASGTQRIAQVGGEVEIRLLRHSLEEALQLWTALQTPFTCALYYDVRIVQLGDA